MTVSRAGRKRKANVPRTKDGKIAWREVREDATLVATWHRARDAYMEFGKNPHLASQAGKMYFFRLLTDAEIEASKRWGEQLHTFDRIVLDRVRQAQPSALERAGVTLRPALDLEQQRLFLERFYALEAVVLEAGRTALRDLNRLCRDEAAQSALPEARKGLAALIAHWHLT